MSEIIYMMERVREQLHHSQNVPAQRIGNALRAFDGLILSNLSPRHADEVEDLFMMANLFRNEYGIKQNEDWAALTPDDTLTAQGIVADIIATCLQSERERVLMELAEGEHQLPKRAIQEVRMHPQVFIPSLLDSLATAISLAEEDKDPEDELHFYAAFLLTELKVSDALPLFERLIRLSFTQSERLLGDAVFELLPSSFAVLLSSDITSLERLIDDPDMDPPHVSVLLTAYQLLVRDEALNREEAGDRLCQRLQTAMRDDKQCLATDLVVALAGLAAVNAMETIREAYDLEMVDSSVIGSDEVAACMERPQETLKATWRSCPPTTELDTITNLKRWASFQDPPQAEAQTWGELVKPSAGAAPSLSAGMVSQRVGRNAPCPCGSGKKFKKCCM